MSRRKSEYKPLLFTTTLRNPSRTKGLLNILSKYNGKILTNELAKIIMGELIRYGLYRPTRGLTSNIIEKWGSKRISNGSSIGIKTLNNDEVKKLLVENPQDHKEAGFEKGWGSRFATVFDFPKELGFVYFWVNEKIEFSEIGLRLANAIKITLDNNYILLSDIHPEFEQQAFLHSMSKYQRNNPFVRVLNDNIPLILLLEVIKKLNSDEEFNGAGISKLELPFIIFWKSNNAEELYNLIKSTRKKYGYKPSGEVIIDICINKIMNGDFKNFKPHSVLVEYPDEFIRKMRLTGLISLRGGGRFIDINTKEIEKVEYVLKTYSSYIKYNTEKEYFDYMATTDINLISFIPTKVNIRDNNKYLDKWVSIYKWEIIKKELYILSNKGLSKDAVLKYLASPVRLEFLISIAIKSKLPNVNVIPNYPCDDEGIPTSTAGGNGNQGDIECFENNNGTLVEVTMSQGRTQTMMEVWPITRHLKEFSKKVENSMCYFIAPTIFEDSYMQIDYVKEKEKLKIVPHTIKGFLEELEIVEELYS